MTTESTMTLFDRHPLRDFLKEKLLSDAIAKGADPVKAKAAVEKVAGDHPIWELLISFDWPAIVAAVLKLVALMA